MVLMEILQPIQYIRLVYGHVREIVDQLRNMFYTLIIIG